VFGNHKGTATKDIPADNKGWLLGQPDVDAYLVKALQGGGINTISSAFTTIVLQA
jgi:hypothetical protein